MTLDSAVKTVPRTKERNVKAGSMSSRGEIRNLDTSAPGLEVSQHNEDSSKCSDPTCLDDRMAIHVDRIFILGRERIGRIGFGARDFGGFHAGIEGNRRLRATFRVVLSNLRILHVGIFDLIQDSRGVSRSMSDRYSVAQNSNVKAE